MLGQRVVPLEHVLYSTRPRAGPRLARRIYVVDHRVPVRPDKAVLRPDDERRARALVQRGAVFQAPRLPLGVRRPPRTRQHVLFLDHRERRWVLTLRVHPEQAVGDVEPLVRVEGDDNVIDFVHVGMDHRGDPSGVIARRRDCQAPIRRVEVTLRGGSGGAGGWGRGAWFFVGRRVSSRRARRCVSVRAGPGPAPCSSRSRPTAPSNLRLCQIHSERQHR
mmetsp:Transcript_67418/g.185905  ORF Transcript_67418/g.185905 Transcript_67418/m.185905 type:complete len:220 (-) Transcript_67418:387-1046(-)